MDLDEFAKQMHERMSRQTPADPAKTLTEWAQQWVRENPAEFGKFVAEHAQRNNLETGRHDNLDIVEQIYSLLVRRGYAQWEAYSIANGPGCACIQLGAPNRDCFRHGVERQQDTSALEPSQVPALHREGTEPLSRVIGELRVLLTKLHPNYPEHASLAGAITQLEGIDRSAPPPDGDVPLAQSHLRGQ